MLHEPFVRRVRMMMCVQMHKSITDYMSRQFRRVSVDRMLLNNDIKRVAQMPSVSDEIQCAAYCQQRTLCVGFHYNYGTDKQCVLYSTKPSEYSTVGVPVGYSNIVTMYERVY
jgi:hypothetical protein